MSARDGSAASGGGSIGRRGFLEAVSLTLAATLSGLLAPVLARAQPGSTQSGTQARAGLAEAPPRGSLAYDDWHIDDMWGHRPRYAHEIPHAPPAGASLDWSRIDPIDRNFIG